MHPVIPGAEPLTVDGSPVGVLVVHGFTGTPQSMRPLARAFADAGYTMSLPLLPGHGTDVEDMIPTRWADWSAAVDSTYRTLAERCESVVVVGLSMGGTLCAWLAAEHPEIAGAVLVNPLIDAELPSVQEMRAGISASDGTTVPGIGSDIAAPGVVELAYPRSPIKPLLSLLDAAVQLKPRLGDIRCPVLLLLSPQDHVVDPRSTDVLIDALGEQVQRVDLRDSFHVATLDHDSALIQRESLGFVERLRPPGTGLPHRGDQPRL